MSNFNLPEEIINEILLCLPVKSVLRFKSVCRAWYLLIKTPIFTRNHFKKTQQNVNPDRAFSAIIAFTRTNEALQLYFSESLDKPVNIALPIISNYDQYQVSGMCQCDGLICLFTMDYSITVVFNPIINECRVIPPFKTPVRLEDCVFWGFRLCEDNGYELTRVVYKWILNVEATIRAEVYNLVTDSWREVDVKMETLVHLTVTCSGYSPILLRGKYYWGSSGSTEDRVVCFDTSREIFYEIKPPWRWSTQREDDWHLQNWKEELALANYLEHGGFSLWVFSENERKWTKNLTINQFPVPFLEYLSYEITVIGCGRNGELVLRCDNADKDELLLYDPVTKIMKLLPYVGGAAKQKVLFIYKESIISPYQH